MDVAARLEVIEEENDVLRERLLVLEKAFGFHWMPPVEWRLTGSEARVFGALMSRDLCRKDALMAALYRDGRDEPEIKIVDVFVCKMRKKLKPFGVIIETRWGEGYFLTPATKAFVNDMMKVAA